MATKKKASPNGTIDYTLLTRDRRGYDWFEMPREDGDDGEPLKARIQRLTLSEIEAIPTGEEKLVDVVASCRQYIVAWNLTGTTDAGDVVPVIPPAEMDDVNARAVLGNLLTIEELQFLYQRLRFGHVYKLDAEKKRSIASAATHAPSPDDSSTA